MAARSGTREDPVTSEWLKELGRNVRRVRTYREMTQAKLAEKADLALRTLQKLEAGEFIPLASTLARLRDALGCSADDILPRMPWPTAK
ncbi:helix-turn-helix transcriptional regulator [Novosphingobium sp.]|uniref:helix-turn-helix transcriptional regulator n=1 Tax=Novosphingobium sp. TaxID=1874826 RepID=UPI003457F22F